MIGIVSHGATDFRACVAGCLAFVMCFEVYTQSYHNANLLITIHCTKQKTENNYFPSGVRCCAAGVKNNPERLVVLPSRSVSCFRAACSMSFRSGVLLLSKLRFLPLGYALLLFLFFDFCHVSVDYGNGRYVHDVAHGTFEIGEVDRLVQSHLDRADYLCVAVKSLQ